MRIVILADRIPPEQIGGAEKVAWALALALHQMGHELHVIAATPHAPYRDVRQGISTYHLHSSYPGRWRHWLSLYNPQVIRPLAQLLQTIKPDVVHAHNIHADLSYASLVTASRQGIPVVFTAHDLMPVVYGKMTHFVEPQTCHIEPEAYRLPPLHNLRENRLRYNPLRNRIIRYILNHHTRLRTALSQAHRLALEANGLPPFAVVPNGLDPAPFESVSSDRIEQLRQHYDLTGQRVILLSGRLSRDKGSRAMLQALNQIMPAIPDACLLMLTSRSLEPGLYADLPQISAAQLRVGGWLDGDDLVAAYHLADVVAFPSIYLDPFGMVNLEAMAARKPLIATCYGGSPDIVKDGETGYIINPFNTDQFADRLKRLLCDDALRQQMGAAGHARLHQHFTLTQQAAIMVAHYKRVLSA